METVNKSKYRELCKQEASSIHVFNQAWWLDIVCCEGYWDAILVERGGVIMAAWPLYFKIRHGVKVITKPKLTQFTDIWFRTFPGQREDEKFFFQKELFAEMAMKISGFASFHQSFNYKLKESTFSNNSGFQLSTSYTYVIENIRDIDTVMSGFDQNKRQQLNRARKEQIEIKYDLPASEFYKFYSQSLLKRNKIISYSEKLFTDLYNSVYSNRSGRVVYAVDPQGNIHCAKFLVWDSDRAYYLINAINPDLKNCGAATLAVLECIKMASIHCNTFDFEGSMIEEVAESFRRFGAIAKPYINLSKTNSKLLNTINFIKEEFFSN
ncbi:GNAT family N-acetyltransferase [Solitalea sp. MAHUQ-68]|uniref:GNAT family N-acetyltransferase n=1 Tax=Solitalea agri TaxID=2953739 RepID=A0A9X2JD14_9SPHI|nr:GNAT family N-acetyltransferase [Solitalea agri]MCO4293648.1 GNAT family N-acetyltransferase [Solitalea agri]